MQALKTTAPGEVLRPLRVLATLIQADLKEALEAAEHAAQPYYRAAGEKLIEARKQCAHGEFMDWAKRHFPVSHTQVNYYMRLAKSTSYETISQMRRETQPSSQSRPGFQPWHEPVKQIVDRVDTETLNLKREELKRADERDAQRKLALQLIDIGYKVLARTLHPDKGGSREAMARLNAVRDRLKNCI